MLSEESILSVLEELSLREGVFNCGASANIDNIEVKNTDGPHSVSLSFYLSIWHRHF